MKSLLFLGFLSGVLLPGAMAADTTAPAAASIAQGVPFDFRGYFRQGADYIFVVSDPAGAETRWLHVGESWRGGRVVSFDARRDQLGVRREGVDLVLPLRGPAQTAPSRTVRILQGSVSPVLEDGKLVYSPDTVLQFGEATITAESGQIKSDLAQTVFEGDFRMNRRNGWTSVARDGKLDAEKGAITLRSGRLQFTRNDTESRAESSPAREPALVSPAAGVAAP